MVVVGFTSTINLTIAVKMRGLRGEKVYVFYIKGRGRV